MLKRGVVVYICWVEAIIINLCLLIARVSRIESLLLCYVLPSNLIIGFFVQKLMYLNKSQ